MADTITSNGAQQTDEILTKEEAKKLHSRLNSFYRKQSTKKKVRPLLKPIGNTNTADKKIVIQQNPVDWDDIPAGTTFALEPSGVLTYVKSSTTKAFCLSTMSPLSVSGGSCYKVFGL